MKRLGVVIASLVCLSGAAWIAHRPFALAAFALALLAALALLVRAVRRDRGFVALDGYEWQRQTPTEIRDPHPVAGVVLPEKRLPRA